MGRWPANISTMMDAISPYPWMRIRFILKRGIAVLCLGGIVAASTAAFSGETGIRESDTQGPAAEMHLPADRSVTPWIHDPSIVEANEGDRTVMREVVEKEVKTIKLDNRVPPIYFGLGEVKIPQDTLQLLREVLDSMRDRANVRLHFIGHTDSLPLGEDLKERYGDNVGLSRERAGTAAEYCQRALNLPPDAISIRLRSR